MNLESFLTAIVNTIFLIGFCFLFLSAIGFIIYIVVKEQEIHEGYRLEKEWMDKKEIRKNE